MNKCDAKKWVARLTFIVILPLVVWFLLPIHVEAKLGWVLAYYVLGSVPLLMLWEYDGHSWQTYKKWRSKYYKNEVRKCSICGLKQQKGSPLHVADFGSNPDEFYTKNLTNEEFTEVLEKQPQVVYLKGENYA